MKSIVGELLKRERKSRNLTLYDVANHVKVAECQISRVENGTRTPSPQLIQDLAQAYELSENELVIASMTDVLVKQYENKRFASTALANASKIIAKIEKKAIENAGLNEQEFRKTEKLTK